MRLGNHQLLCAALAKLRDAFACSLLVAGGIDRDNGGAADERSIDLDKQTAQEQEEEAGNPKGVALVITAFVLVLLFAP